MRSTQAITIMNCIDLWTSSNIYFVVWNDWTKKNSNRFRQSLFFSDQKQKLIKYEFKHLEKQRIMLDVHVSRLLNVRNRNDFVC